MLATTPADPAAERLGAYAVRILDPTGDRPPHVGDFWRVVGVLGEVEGGAVARERAARVPGWTWLLVGVLAGLGLSEFWP